MVSIPLKRSKRLLSSMAGLFLAAAPGFAQVFTADFNSGVPAGSSLPLGPAADPNEAIVDGGYLKLTQAVNSSCGFYYIDNFTGTTPVNRFIATFKASLFGSTCCGGGLQPADGFSFNLVPAATLNPNPAYIASELGLAEGLAVTFDSWDNAAPGPDGPNLKVKWQGAEIGVANIQPSQSPVGATTAAAAAKDVVISLHPDGKIDVTYGGLVAFAGLQTPYSAAAIGTPAWVFTARTGGANDNHWIDDLKIVTEPSEIALFTPEGTVWAYNDTTLTSANLHGTGWELPTYDTNSAPGWKNGPALLGNDGDGIYNGAGQPFSGGTFGFLTPLDRGTSDRATFYFRKKFNWTGSAAGVTLVSSNWVDDGFVAYLNGVEVSRIRVPAGPVTWDTLGENPPTEGVVEVRTWDSASLVEGENTIAVELHQSSLGSSDVAFAIGLSAVGPLFPTITDPIQPTNRIVLANRETVLIVDAIGSPAVTYQWYKDGTPIDGATGSSYTIAQMGASDAGDYFCRVANSLGSVESRTAVVAYNFDDSPPAIAEISGSATFDKVNVTFNELVDDDPITGSAVDVFNYSIVDEGGNPLGIVQAEGNGKTIILTTDPQTPNTLYTVTVINVADRAGNAIDGFPGISGTFRSWVPGPCNGVLFETYDVGTASLGIDDLISNQPNFPNNPRERILISGFDSRLAYADDSHEFYAGRMTGLFIPPVSGNWLFHMRSDDPGRLFINPTGPSAAGKVRVGEQSGCCNAFPAGGLQLSAPIPLEAGKGYYVELLWREFGGGDYGQVAVQLQGQPAPAEPTLVGGLVGAGAAPAGVGGPLTISQQPASLEVVANTLVSFSVGAQNPNGLPVCYQWRRDGVEIPGANLATYSFGPVSVGADNGATFDCLVSIIGASATSVQATLTVAEDTTSPTVVSVKATTELSRLVVVFSEFLNKDSAEDEFNYEVQDGSEVVSTTLGADGKTVTVKLRDPLNMDTTYNLSISGVTDLAGNEMAPVVLPFRTFAPVPGFALKELYLNIGGGVLVTDLTGNEKYPSAPDLVRYGGLAELNTFDEFESYGARMSGWITAPASGNYNFFMSSDDGGAFYLSTDASPANLVPVASEPVWNGRRDWLGTTRRNAEAPENKSSTLFPDGIPLVAGQMYYFEALMKEGGGGDNLAFTWQQPGSPEPLSGSAALSGIYLSALADPSGASLQITQQPTDQVYVIANDTLVAQSFDSNNGGFTVETPDGAFNTPWVYDGGGNWVVRQDAAEVGHPMTAGLVSPEYTVSKAGGVTLRMSHRWSAEQGFWDGGAIQLSVNGGAFASIPAASLTQGGYNGTVLANSASALKGQQAFVQDSPAEYSTTVASLGTFNPGDKIRIRFLYAGDTNSRGNRPESWQIDSFQLNQGGGAAQNVTFSVAIEASKAGETTPTTSFQWMRDNGAGFQPVDGGNGPSLTFTPVFADNGAKFKCEVYILGAHQTSVTASLLVAVPNTAPRFTGGGDDVVDKDSGPRSVANWATGIEVHSISRTPTIYENDFAAGLAGMQAFGNAAVVNGVLQLTTPINSIYGAASISAAPTTYESLTVKWKSLVGGGEGGGADGYSLNIGDDVPADPGYGGEEGIGTGLTVTVDTFDNGTGEDVGVDIKWRGARVAYVNIAKDDDGSGNFIRKNTFVDAQLTLTAEGVASVTYDGNTISATLANYVGLRADRALFWARTGGANDNQWVDDFSFIAFQPDSSSVENGQTVHFIVENSNPSLFSVQPAVSADGTLTYTPAPGACGSAVVTVVAMDDGGTSFGGNDTSAPATFRITVAGCNRPPVFVPVPGIMLNVGQHMVVTNRAVDPDLPAQALTFSLNPGAPAGARLVSSLPGQAVLHWTPSQEYASSTQTFQVVVCDNGAPSLCATQEVKVVVNEYLSLELGQTVRRVNEAGSVPLKVLSSVGVRRICFTLDVPTPGYLTGVSLEKSGPRICTITTTEQSPTRWRFCLEVCAGEQVVGMEEVARLNFTTLDKPSAFISLEVSAVDGERADGMHVTQVIGRPGRVAVIGVEPLLEMTQGPGRELMLMLYGNPGTSYRVESTDRLGDLPPMTTWQTFMDVELTELTKLIPLPVSTDATKFYRALRP